MLCATIPVQQLQNCFPKNPAPHKNHQTATEIPSSLQAWPQTGKHYFKVHLFIISALGKKSRILNDLARMIREKKMQGYTWTWSFKSLLKIWAVTNPDIIKNKKRWKEKRGVTADSVVTDLLSSVSQVSQRKETSEISAGQIELDFWVLYDLQI